MISLSRSPLGVEALDAPDCPPDVAHATLEDIAVANTLFGGRAAAWFGLERLLPEEPPRRPLRLLDVGAGSCDIARHLVRRAARRSVGIDVIGCDFHATATMCCREGGTPAVLGDASALPFANRSVDIVLASQLLHHLARPSAVALVRALTRLARVGVIIADIRRSRLAAAGIWLAATALRFHPTTRRDGVLSVRRGFSVRELTALLADAGVAAHVHRRPGFRLVAAWSVHADG